MTWCHIAELWETIADAIPDEVAIVNDGVRRTWQVYEDRAARLAATLVEAGLKPDSKIGIYGYNSNEYVEAHYSAFKMRGVAVNLNYRYTADELAYVLENADAEALYFDAGFGSTVALLRKKLPKLRLLIEIDDGSGEHLEGALPYETAISTHAPLPRPEYSADDIYMLYTGGTTGMPKGVMYRHGDLLQALLPANDTHGVPRPGSPEEFAEQVRRTRAEGRQLVNLAACPLMHGTGLWAGVFMAHNMGGVAVTFRNAHFDAAEMWRLAERERVTDIAIVGDAFAKPMLDALRRGADHDLSALKMIFSSGVMFSREVKEGLLEFADVTIVDSMGSSEGGMARSVVSRSQPAGATAAFQKHPGTKLFDEQDREILPGSDEIGRVASGGAVPIGYYKDPVKTAATFRTIEGHRYSFPGDFGRYAPDGELILLGRGSNCINTGGEKVFPEEVEEVLKAHPDVYDCLVVGVPDDRFGESIAAVVSARPGHAPDEGDLAAFVRGVLAGYKTPRRFIFVDAIRRAANGKSDYPWARQVARGEAKEP